MNRAPHRIALLIELCRVLLVLPQVEAGRRLLGPRPLLETLRRRGRRARRRDTAARARLRRAIAWIDSRCPGGANCYRRSLLEVALDPSAAAEPFRMGFRAGAGSVSGHAWLGASAQDAERYDVELAL
jgi:hypothetical protein